MRDPAQPIPAFSLGGLFSPILLVPMAVPLFIALFAPANILHACPIALSFTSKVRQAFSFMDIGHAASTEQSQVTALTHCATLVVIPLCIAIWVIQGLLNYPYVLQRRRLLGRLEISQHLLLLLAGPPLFLGAAYIFINFPGDPGFAQGLTTKGRIGLAFMTFCMTYSTSLAVGFQPTNIRLFIDTYLKKGD